MSSTSIFLLKLPFLNFWKLWKVVFKYYMYVVSLVCSFAFFCAKIIKPSSGGATNLPLIGKEICSVYFAFRKIVLMSEILQTKSKILLFVCKIFKIGKIKIGLIKEI